MAGITSPDLSIKPLSPIGSISEKPFISASPLELGPVIKPTSQELDPLGKLPGPETHSTPIPSTVGVNGKVDELTKALEQLGVPQKEIKEIAPSAPTQKNILEKLGPLKMVGLGGIGVLLMNLWKGIQSLWKKPEEGGGPVST